MECGRAWSPAGKAGAEAPRVGDPGWKAAGVASGGAPPGRRPTSSGCPGLTVGASCGGARTRSRGRGLFEKRLDPGREANVQQSG